MPPSLKARVRGGESGTLEYKETCPHPWKLARVISAFANGAGGDICIGVDDRARIVGMTDAAYERQTLESALDYTDPRPEVRIDAYTHELKDVLVVAVQPMEFPDFCFAEDEGEFVAYVRVRSETRPLPPEVVKAAINLRRRSHGDRSVTPEGQRLITHLWDKGELIEAKCARLFNYSKQRLRKLAESLIGSGYLVACRVGEGRSYAAIHPGPGRRP